LLFSLLILPPFIHRFSLTSPLRHYAAFADIIEAASATAAFSSPPITLPPSAAVFSPPSPCSTPRAALPRHSLSGHAISRRFHFQIAPTLIAFRFVFRHYAAQFITLIRHISLIFAVFFHISRRFLLSSSFFLSSSLLSDATLLFRLIFAIDVFSITPHIADVAAAAERRCRRQMRESKQRERAPRHASAPTHVAMPGASLAPCRRRSCWRR
jgi:hypothetical protein